MSIIKVENLSKKYIINHKHQESYTNLRDVLSESVKNFGVYFDSCVSMEKTN